MTLTAPQRHNIKALALCALYAFVLLFFLSLDSYLYDIFYRTDSAVFFMCGKAWMNGLIPYADFADSKGPLLWLIYGIGYLLNHHSYVGVFWMSVLFYTATLFIAYKLSRLFLEPRPAALCVAILPFALFLHWVNMETSTEDFCYTFVTLSLYCLCRIIKEKDLPARTFFRLALAIGVSFPCCLLLKWNIGLMIGSIMLVAFILSFKRKDVGACIGGLAIGVAIIAVPFLIYFICFADFEALIQEYFVNTYLTMHGRTNIMDAFTFDMAMIDREKFVIVLLVGMLIFTWKHRAYFWLLLCFLIFRIGLGSGHNGYFSILMPYAIFFIICIVALINSKLPRLLRFTPLLCILAAVFSISSNYLFWWNANDSHERTLEKREQFYKAAYVMAQVEKPTLFMCPIFECGLGVPVNALPSCRYWILQRGATDEMVAEREENLRDCHADFIMHYSRTKPEESKEHAILTAQGYSIYIYMNSTETSTSLSTAARAFSSLLTTSTSLNGMSG